MPTVPQYPEQQVRESPFPNVRIPNNVPDYSSAFTGIASKVGQVNREIQSFQQHEQDQADTFRAEAQINKLRDAETEMLTGKGGALNLEGENVFKLGESLSSFYGKQYDEKITELQGELANDNQRRRFGIVAGRLRSQFSRTLGVHEGNENRAFRESTFKGIVQTETEVLSRALDDPNLDERTKQIGASIGRVTANAMQHYVNDLGLNREQANAETLKLESSMHGTVIDRYLEKNDPVSAKQYYEANKDRINAGDATKARQQIEKDGRDFLINQAADDLWSTMGPKSDDDPVNLDLMERQANRLFEKDAEGRKGLIAELGQRQQAHDYSAGERKTAVTGGIWKQVLANTPLSKIRRSPEFRGLDGKTQAQTVEQIEKYQKRNENDPGTVLAKFAQYWSVAGDPERLKSMSDAAIFEMAPRLGPELTKTLLATKQKLNQSDEKVIEAKIDQDSFKYWAAQAGLDVTPPPDSQKAKDLGSLKYRVETLIDAEQQKKGKALTRDEKDAILKKLLVEVPVTVKGMLWGTNVEPRRLFEVQYPENIQISKTDRELIVGALRKGGVQNPTEPQIREGFIRLRMK